MNFRDVILQEMTAYVHGLRRGARDMFPNRKIEQIKYLREMTGFGLRQAKDIVEADDCDQRDAIIQEAINTAIDLVPTTLSKEDWQYIGYIISEHIAKTKAKPGEPSDSVTTLQQRQRIQAYVFAQAFPPK